MNNFNKIIFIISIIFISIYSNQNIHAILNVDEKNNYFIQIVYDRYYFIKQNEIYYNFLESNIFTFNDLFGYSKELNRDSLTFVIASGFDNDTLKIWENDSLIYHKIVITDNTIGLSDIFSLSEKINESNHNFAIQVNNGKKAIINFDISLKYIEIDYDYRQKSLIIKNTNRSPSYE